MVKSLNTIQPNLRPSVNEPSKVKLFSKFSVIPLVIGLVGLFIAIQTVGVIIFTPFVFNEEPLTISQIFELGGLNGTVTSYAFLFTLVILTVTILGLIKWRIHSIDKNKKSGKEALTAQHKRLNTGVIAESTEVKRLTLFDYLAIKPFTFKVGVIVLGLWVLFLIGSEAFSRLFYRDPTAFMDVLYLSAEPKWLLIFVVVIAAPIYEELIFRGILWSAIREQLEGVKGLWLASIVTSLLFAVIHFQYAIYELSVIFILALLLSYARVKSGSLWLPIIIHIINNGLTMWVYVT